MGCRCSRSQLAKRVPAGLGLPAGPLVGVFSRLAAWKGQHVLLEALSALPGVGCIIVGDALFGEQAYAAELKEMVAELGLADRVRFLGHRGDVPKLMQAVDVMVHPSIDPEPFGRTLVEAMLAGRAGDRDRCRRGSRILEGGKAGTLVPPNDAQALARAIAAVLAKPDACGQLDYAVACARSAIRRGPDAGVDRASDRRAADRSCGMSTSLASTARCAGGCPAGAGRPAPDRHCGAQGSALGALASRVRARLRARRLVRVAAGAGRALQAALTFFMFAPFVRRIVDLRPATTSSA